MCPLAIPADWKCERERFRVGIAGMFREVGEKFHLHGSEQDLGSPEGEAGLQNAVRCQSHGRDVVEEHALWHEKAATVIWRLAGPRGIGVRPAMESITACMQKACLAFEMQKRTKEKPLAETNPRPSVPPYETEKHHLSVV
jgi:capsid protein